MRLRVQSVTVFAFSIENFKRPPDEVAMLMDLLTEKLHELCRERCDENCRVFDG
jgi:undecaprenyl diphosphate synthase